MAWGKIKNRYSYLAMSTLSFILGVYTIIHKELRVRRFSFYLGNLYLYGTQAVIAGVMLIIIGIYFFYQFLILRNNGRKIKEASIGDV